MVKRPTNPEAAPISEREAMRRDTHTVRARVVTQPLHDAGHTPLVVDIAALHAWLLRNAEERAVPRFPWAD